MNRYQNINVFIFTFFSDGGKSWLEGLFEEWGEKGMVVRLDIRHWIHRWDAVVLRQSHAKYGMFMSAVAGALLAYNNGDLQQLIAAVRAGDPALYGDCDDFQMLAHLKPDQLRKYVRRVTRVPQEMADTMEHILQEFKGPAGRDVEGIGLFKSDEAVDAQWAISMRHLECMQVTLP